ncbi:MAG: UDP-N-acetylglucosamine--N-acetylmuramyl-(pentapeptide) pyrophosphoryl-undecaprenol N-acetylglucosamine transferase [Alphaproteobacteria bacterium BRH_c36]|nr:MAG: UDP-N-acetylglucosamine--N-acetylmuramyl-(pentapeptide) pyrophosphoryl-undecaprenol N-acetylglucosamine transferase [Alphaproteobacteria bacterium BRH_c36]
MPCILLAAGGTGGHLFPAFALAEELARRGYLVDLVTDMRGDRYGTGFPARKVHQIPSATLTGKSPVAVAQTVWTLSRGITAAVKLLGDIRPAVVIGFGGYPTFPPLMAAKLRGVKTALHEQNAVLGRANRMLAARVDAIATSFQHVKFLDGPLAAKTRFTGNPVRDVVIELSSRPYWTPDSSDTIQLLVFGGSQGARFFSDTVPPAMTRLPQDIRQRLRIVQQARQEDVERVRQAYAQSGISADIAPFFPDLPDIMANSHLIIGRAGASTIAELTVMGRPSILVPLPHALDNDQLQNAAMLAESGGAWCIEQKDLDADRLANEVERLIRDPMLLLNAANAARSQGKPDAVQRLAELVAELAG